MDVIVDAESVVRSEVWELFHWAIDAQREMRMSV